jgi:ppGpp synthetase/RelA/SpoT-type nucleotidyltranferase
VLLQQLRLAHDEALATVQRALADALPEAMRTSRLKTVGTIVDKLRREETMRLSRMQDIAGVRIVGPSSRAEQDAIVSRLTALFPGARIVDRRAQPSHGYRAVHVIVPVDGRLVEIQVRTLLQEWWAETVERLGDTWGRQIRYGEGPADPTRAILDGKQTRAVLWQQIQAAADMIDQFEQTSDATTGLTGFLSTVAAILVFAILTHSTSDPTKL